MSPSRVSRWSSLSGIVLIFLILTELNAAKPSGTGLITNPGSAAAAAGEVMTGCLLVLLLHSHRTSWSVLDMLMFSYSLLHRRRLIKICFRPKR